MQGEAAMTERMQKKSKSSEKKQILVVTNAITNHEIDQIKKAFIHHSNNPTPDQLEIQVSLVHVIPRLPTCYFNIPSMSVLIEKYYDEAKNSLHEVGKHLNVAKKDQWLISGKIRTEVLRLATRLGSSFILASAQQIQELQRSLFFKNIHQYALIKNINQLKAI